MSGGTTRKVQFVVQTKLHECIVAANTFGYRVCTSFTETFSNCADFGNVLCAETAGLVGSNTGRMLRLRCSCATMYSRSACNKAPGTSLGSGISTKLRKEWKRPIHALKWTILVKFVEAQKLIES